MKKYWFTGILALFLLFICSNKVLADGFQQTSAERDRALQNWEQSLVGTSFSDSNTDLKKLLDAKEDTFKKEILNRYTDSPDILFTDMPKTLNDFGQVAAKVEDKEPHLKIPTRWTSTQWTTAAKRIEEMAILYKTPNSSYYKDKELGSKIIKALEWYNKNIYSAPNGFMGITDSWDIKVGSEKPPTNGSVWYDNQIAAPLSLVNTLALMGNTDEKTDESNKIPTELLQKYMLALDYFEPSIYNGTSASGDHVGTGANRINKGFVILLRGIIDSNADKAQVGIDTIRRGYLTVTAGDGYYSDGSFIQHQYLPYNTGYGADALARFADLYRLFDGTNGMRNYTGSLAIFNLLDTAYAHVFYKNETLDMTRGRTIAFPTNKSENFANTMMYNIYTISAKKTLGGNTDTEYINKYRNFVKSSIFEKSLQPNFYANLTLPEAQAFQALLADSGTSSEYSEKPTNVMMSRASQMIDQKPGYKVGLSMFSKNVSAFEYLSATNLLGFYTGTGALSLYNGDDAFKDDYYPTVGMTSLPGTTTDLMTRNLVAEGVEDNQLYPNTESWTGGISDKVNGSATMDYTMKKVTGSNLKASKSWFFLNGKIVAMGNGISNTGGPNTQTIVENRQLLDTSRAFSVNGQNISLSNPVSQITNAKWAHLDGTTTSQDIGYVFPYPTNVDAYKREQSGKWKDMSTRNTNDNTVTATYAGLTIPHGANPSNASYMYMILPGSSKENTEKMATDSGILTTNTSTIQGVLDKEQDLAIMNYRAPGEAGYPTITNHNYNSKAYTPGSIMICYATTEDKQTKTITLSDPSREADSIHFSVPKESYTAISAQSEKGTVTSAGDNWDITVDTTGKSGESFQFTFEKEPPALKVNNFTLGTDSYVKGTYTGDITKIALEVDGTLKSTISVSNSVYQYYALSQIKALTNEVYIIGYDSSGSEVARSKVAVYPKPQIIANNFAFGTDSSVTGTYVGDISNVALEIDGTINTKIPVSGPSYQYDALNLIQTADDKVYIVGYNSAGIEVTRSAVTVYVKPEITANNFTFDTDTYVKGTFAGDVSRIALEINGTINTKIPVSGSSYQYYAFSLIKATTDKVHVVGYDSTGAEVTRSEVIVSAKPEITANNFSLGIDSYVKGTYTGDITQIALKVDGLVKSMISVSSSVYQYYALRQIDSTTNEVYIIGYNSSGTELAHSKVAVYPKPEIKTNTFTIGTDSYVEGTYAGNIAKISLEVDGVVKSMISVTGSAYKYYALNQIQKTSKEVYIIGYDPSGTELKHSKVTLQ